MPLPKPKIKVFRAHLGFYDTIVAVTSRLKALAAWGASGDLFAHGGAEETKDPDAVKAATARPGVILRRAFGSNDSWEEHPAPPDMPKPKILTARQRSERKRETAERKKREASEKHSARLQAAERKELDRLERQRARLAEEEEKIRAKFSAKKRGR